MCPLDGFPEYRRLADFGVATIYDAAPGNGLVDIDLCQIIPGSHIAGPARTLLLGPKGNRAVHEVMRRIVPGEVLVIAAREPEPIALIGELLALQAKLAGAVGILIDGAVRDVDAIRELGLPVWSRWVRAKSAGKTEESLNDVSVTIGGALINPEDAVILDSDGAVVVAKDRISEITAVATEREYKEKSVRTRLAAGEYTYEIYGFGI